MVSLREMYDLRKPGFHLTQGVLRCRKADLSHTSTDEYDVDVAPALALALNWHAGSHLSVHRPPSFDDEPSGHKRVFHGPPRLLARVMECESKTADWLEL